MNNTDVVMSDFSRRSLLKLGLAGTAVALGAASGCTSESDPNQVPASQRIALPAYIPFRAAVPDLKGEKGSADAFLHYPQNPPATISERPGDGSPINAMLSIFYPAWPPAGRNAALHHLNDELGSEMVFQQVPGTDYAAKVATVVAGNDLPTMMEIDSSVPNLPELMKAKFIDLSSHLSGDAIKKYPNIANLSSDVWPAGIFNNAIYGIPTARGMWQSGVMFQRRDLIKAKGLTADDIGSFADLFALSKQLTDSRNSTWALAAVPTDYIRQMLDVPNVWRLDKGKLTNAYEVPEQQEVLNACIKLWKAGVVHPDGFALNGEQVRQYFLAGRTMICNGSYQGWSRFYKEQPQGKPLDLQGLPLPGFSGGKGTFWLAAPAYSIGAIPKGNEKRVETLLKVWNYLIAPFGSAEYLNVVYGQKGQDYRLNGSDPVQTTRGQREAMLLTTLVCAPEVAYYPNSPHVAKDTYAHMKAMTANNPTRNPALYIYSQTQSRKGGALDAQMVSDFNDIIQGRKPVSAWQDSVAAWRSGGGDKIRGELEEGLSRQ